MQEELELGVGGSVSFLDRARLYLIALSSLPFRNLKQCVRYTAWVAIAMIMVPGCSDNYPIYTPQQQQMPQQQMQQQQPYYQQGGPSSYPPSYPPQPQSRYYSDPYAIQPQQQQNYYYPYYDADRYYVPPTSVYNSTDQNRSAGDQNKY